MRQIIYAIIILYSILIISGCNGNKTTNKLMPELEQAEKVPCAMVPADDASKV